MLSVNTLGKFQISKDNHILSDDNIRSAMMTKLLLFMIIHRGQSLTTDEIATALWQEEEVENPAGALKNLMYRLRNLLKKHFDGTEFIITSRGAYCWNPDVEVMVDAEAFEALSEKGKAEEGSEAISYYESAIRLYQGEFMSKLVEMYWVVTMNAYYHSLYLSVVKGLAELYIQAEKYDELESICSAALAYDNVDEQLYYYLILARMKKNKLKLAMEAYEEACSILYQELGIRKPAALQEIYEELLKMSKCSKAEDMEHVQQNIREENAEGVFFCGYPIFREIYRLEARKITRLGEAEYVMLLTIRQNEKQSGTMGQIEQFRLKKAVDNMEHTLKESLRIGDVAARYSDSQFVILLPSCSYECGMQVAKRIVSKFYGKSESYGSIKVGVNLEAVAAVSTIVN